ncbi:MAG: 3'-5' exonuclease domain-containing protein 2 [Paramuribaculum sp.]|nr:3'-5' exonuclease domain-containing protein 2 [Paramuribaculum sp.]
MTKSPIAVSIPKEILSSLPPVRFAGRVSVIDSPAMARQAIAFLSCQPIVGFDTETRPNFRKGQNHTVSLIQISTAAHAFLFRINKTGIIPELRQFLENPDVAKIGLSLKDDFHNLHKICPFEPQGFIELQNLVKEYSITDASLQKIFAILFGERISKGQRLSNWEAIQLTEAQQTYAAIDAWACLKIYTHLKAGLFIPDQSPYILPEPEQQP